MRLVYIYRMKEEKNNFKPFSGNFSFSRMIAGKDIRYISQVGNFPTQKNLYLVSLPAIIPAKLPLHLTLQVKDMSYFLLYRD